VYIFGRALYGAWVGFFAALLVLSSYGINYASGFMLPDNLIVVFILLYLFISYKAILTSKKWLFIVSGIILALTFYCKPFFTPFLFFLLPVMVFVAKEKLCKKRLSNLLLFFIFFFLTLAPWIIYASLNGAGIFKLFGGKELGVLVSNREVFELSVWQQLYLFMLKVLDVFSPATFIKLYAQHLKKFFILAPLMILSIAYLIFRVIRCRKFSDTFLLFSILSISPVILSAANAGNRMSTLLIIYPLLYLMIALSIKYGTALVSKLLKKYSNFSLFKKDCFPKVFCVFVAIILIWFQWSNGTLSTKKMLVKGPSGGTKWTNTFWLTDDFVVEGRYNNNIKDASRWLLKNVDTNSNIVVAHGKGALDFFTLNSYNYRTLEPYPGKIIRQQLAKGRVKKDADRLLFLYPYEGFSYDAEWSRHVYFVFEGDIWEQLRQADSKYVFLGDRHLYLSFYFDKHPSLELRYANKSTRIYEIIGAELRGEGEHRLVVYDGYEKLTERWKERYPDEFDKYQELLQSVGVANKDFTGNTYTDYQIAWVKEKIPPDAKIGYHWHTGEFLIKGLKNAEFIGYKKHKLSNLLDRYDYLFIHNHQFIYNTFPPLFKELKDFKPIKSFPTIYAMGDNGWQIYDLKAIRKQRGLD